ncbi:MAG: hypothetical protein H6573_26945 [Lewinellaceae bacterium]|nr:hypothetical protein [Lewinellaceae bacterium]
MQIRLDRGPGSSRNIRHWASVSLRRRLRIFINITGKQSGIDQTPVLRGQRWLCTESEPNTNGASIGENERINVDIWLAPSITCTGIAQCCIPNTIPKTRCWR